MNGSSSLRMATKKAGPVVTDQGTILDVLFNDGIKNPKDIELTLNNIPGVLENGLFVDLTDKALAGKIETVFQLFILPQSWLIFKSYLY